MISFYNLKQANLSRCMQWHPGGVNSWSLSDWGVAAGGEMGEMLNVIKKLNRLRDGLRGNKETEEELRISLGKEIADTVIYLDLLASAAGFDLGALVKDKFNEVSQRNGFQERL
jgi:NTP pyrophosphatase (non-canonical NTP hydrolase)